MTYSRKAFFEKCALVYILSNDRVKIDMNVFECKKR